MSWEYWHYPDNLRKTCHLPWRCFTALYLAFADSRYWIDPPVRGAIFSCPPFRHGHLNVACRRPRYFWNYFSEYAEKVENHIRDLMVGRAYIKPDYEGVIFVAGEEEGEYIYDENMFWSEEEFEQLLLDENGQKISYSEIPNNVRALAWMQKMYELIGLLTRQVVEVDVKYFGKVGSNRMSQGPDWFGMTPKGAVRHTTFKEEPSKLFPNGVEETYYLSVGHSHGGSTIVAHDEEKVVLRGSKVETEPYGSYSCTMYLGRIGIMFDERFNLAVNMVTGAVVAGKLCDVCHSKDAEFWSGIGLTEGVNSFTPPNSGWILRKPEPDSDTGNPPPWAAISEYGVPEAVDESFAPGDDAGEVNIERGCEIKKAAVIMDVDPLIPPTWEEYLGWLKNGRPYQLKLKEEPSASPGDPEGEYPNDHGLIPESAGGFVEKLKTLAGKIYNAENLRIGGKLGDKPVSDMETWEDTYSTFHSLVVFEPGGSWISPNYNGDVVDSSTGSVKSGVGVTAEDRAPLYEIQKKVEELYFKLANKDIVEQGEAESAAEALLNEFKDTFIKIYYKRYRRIRMKTMDESDRKSAGTKNPVEYENLQSEWESLKSANNSYGGTGYDEGCAFDWEYLTNNPQKYHLRVSSTSYFVQIDAPVEIEVQEAWYYASAKNEENFKSTCEMPYKKWTSRTPDMDRTKAEESINGGILGVYAFANLCEAGEPPEVPPPMGDPNPDFPQLTIFSGSWGANYSSGYMVYTIKWDDYLGD